MVESDIPMLTWTDVSTLYWKATTDAEYAIL